MLTLLLLRAQQQVDPDDAQSAALDLPSAQHVVLPDLEAAEAAASAD